MANIVASLSNNILKVSAFSIDGSEKFKGVSAELVPDVVSDSVILKKDVFSEVLSDLVSDVLSQNFKERSKSTLHFLLEPQDLIIKFVTVNKIDGDVATQIINEVKSKLVGFSIEDLFFSYQKIAPFVYQFVGVKKDILDMYIDISNIVNIELRAIVPWIYVLPKYANINAPCIFIADRGGKQVVALSDLNGIYFTGIFDEHKASKELEKKIKELAVYKRVTPISKIYTLNYDSFNLDPTYEVISIDATLHKTKETESYELHLFYNNLIASMPDLLTTQANLLTLLPVPAVEKRNTSLVYTGVAASTLILLLSIFGIFMLVRNKNANTNKQLPGENPVVLSDTNQSSETTESSAAIVTPTPTVQLNRTELKIRVENGAGITGLAAKTRTFLQGKGYTVTGVGDAAESDRANTLVKIKISKKDYKDILMTDMKSAYDMVVEEGLSETADYDVLVTCGKK